MSNGLSRGVAADGGFTLIELLVVVLLIGIMASIAVPQYARVVEKSRAAEAIAALNSLKGSQDRYFNKYGAYCLGLPSAGCLDIGLPDLRNFSPWPAIQAGTTPPSWKVTLQRKTATAHYGAYTLSYDVEPNAKPALTCSNALCTSDLLPTIF